MVGATPPVPINSPHIRSVNPSSDLDAIADLIELCFPIHLDQDGQRYIREMRKAARDMRLLGWLASMGDMTASKIWGFVWEEDQRIIGNLSLIPFQKEGKQVHLIANVAVHPDYRQQGIARAITNRALSYLKRIGNGSTWLQVRDDNPAAINLYRSVGFREQFARTTWHIRPCEFRSERVVENADILIRKCRAGDWQLQQVYLQETYPRQMRWNLPINFLQFNPDWVIRISNFLNGLNLRQWAAHKQSDLLGCLTWQKTQTFADNLWLGFQHEVENYALPVMLRHVFRRLRQRQPISIDFPAGRFVNQFIDLGFTKFRTLIWMECQLN